MVQLSETDANGALALAEASGMRSGSRALLVQRVDEALYSGKAAGHDYSHQAVPETETVAWH